MHKKGIFVFSLYSMIKMARPMGEKLRGELSLLEPMKFLHLRLLTTHGWGHPYHTGERRNELPLSTHSLTDKDLHPLCLYQSFLFSFLSRNGSIYPSPWLGGLFSYLLKSMQIQKNVSPTRGIKVDVHHINLCMCA